jgi:hypothetical protein
MTVVHAMPRRAGRVALALTALSAAASAVLLVLGPGRSLPADVFGGVGGASFVVLSLAFATVGSLVASRVPQNRIGWIFCLTGLLVAVSVLAWVYADYGLYATSGRLPGAAGAAAFPGEPLAAVFAFVVLLFPDGRLPSDRWRPAAYVIGLAALLLFVTDVLRPGALDDPFATVSNPLGVPGTRGVMDAVNNAGWLLVTVGLGLAAASLLVRLRRARGIERQQLKLVLAVGAVVVVVTALAMTTWLVWPRGDLQVRMALLGLSYAGFPVAAGVAVLRYRLYDIDLVINRTLVYGALTATLAVVYLGSVLVLQFTLSGVAGGSGLAVAASTLVAAALFRPARARIQAAVDRRFYRRKYDAQRTLEGFSGRLRDEVDLVALNAELGAVVRETLQPAHVSVWLRSPEMRA